MNNALSRVISSRKRQELLDVLHKPHPSHNQRLWLVGFLRYVGYSESEIRGIIHSENRWRNYVKQQTAVQVHSVTTRRPRAGHRGGTPPKMKNELTIYDLIEIFKKNTRPFGKLSVPSDIKDAALFYHSLGITPLPKHAVKKRPSIIWMQYQTRTPTFREITSWDWSNGICLLASDQYCFLDIDSGGHESAFDNWHLELTPRGGLHVFGKGNLQSLNIDDVGEIKGKGTLIVAYPTPGYKLI